MTEDPELAALAAVYEALAGLDAGSQQRVIDYISRKFDLVAPVSSSSVSNSLPAPLSAGASVGANQGSSNTQHYDMKFDVTDDTDGISPVAIKWMQRNGFTVDQLGHLFSLGTDEIDLVAKSVPGTSKNQRTRSVAILKGIAAYLSSGAARMTAEQIKEACLHYDAYDPPNHAKYLRGMSTELSGSKETGFTLTARGLTAGTELIREVIGVGT